MEKGLKQYQPSQEGNRGVQWPHCCLILYIKHEEELKDKNRNLNKY